jgi:hypothetical protein
MASDPANGTVVFFGGPGIALDGNYTNSTWTWDGRTWTEHTQADGPSARGSAALAYDPATRTVVLFGGLTGAFIPGVTFPTWLGDTWTWDGSHWTQQIPAHSPDPRTTNMATDPANGDVLLQGGTGVGFQNLTDTWTWDGKDWTKQPTDPDHQPPPGATVVGDPATRTVVAFGGGSSFMDLTVNDTWIWDGHDWMQKFPKDPPSPRVNEVLAYDPIAHNVVLFGGELGHAPFLSDETWTWDGTVWTQQQTPDQPSLRTGEGMATDPATCSVVLFGGLDLASFPVPSLSDTWLFTAGPRTPEEVQENQSAHQHEHPTSGCPGINGKRGL